MPHRCTHAAVPHARGALAHMRCNCSAASLFIGGEPTANVERLVSPPAANLVSKQFLEEAEEGLMIETTVEAALDEFGDELNIASTGAIVT